MVDLFHWSLADLDDTDMETLLPFVFRYSRWKGGHGRRQMCIDEVNLGL